MTSMQTKKISAAIQAHGEALSAWARVEKMSGLVGIPSVADMVTAARTRTSRALESDAATGIAGTPDGALRAASRGAETWAAIQAHNDRIGTLLLAVPKGDPT